MPKEKRDQSSSEDVSSTTQPISTEPLPFFDISPLFDKTQTYSTAFIGSRHSGKTFCLSSIWKRLKETNDFLFFFCNNPQAKGYKFMSEKEKKRVFDEYQPKVIEALNKFQKITKNAARGMVIFDDCSSRVHNKYDNQLQQLYIRGRNIMTGILFSTQAPQFLTKESRGNLDYAFIFKLNSSELKELVAKNFLWSVAPLPREPRNKQDKLDLICQWIDLNTDDHWAIVVDYRNGNVVYKYKAPSGGGE